MVYNNLQIYINQNFYSNSIEVWVIELQRIKQYNISCDENGKLVETEIDEMGVLTINDKLKPFLNLPMRFANELFKRLAEYNDKNGVKTVDQNLLEGKLMATEDHLKDMKEMSKKLLDAYISQKD
jgi:hypothetical protein